MKRAFMSITLLVLSLSMVMMLLMGVAAAAWRVCRKMCIFTRS